jgi:hypothetical protein
MELWEKQAIFAQNAAKLLIEMHAKGFNPTLSEAYRTPEQAALNAKDGKGISHSLHTERLAIDINLLDKDGKYLTDKDHYALFREFWLSLHPYNRFGGDFTHLVDSNHFEMQNL